MAHRRMLLRHDDHGDYEKIKVPCRKSRGQRNCWRDPGDGEELSPGFFMNDILVFQVKYIIIKAKCIICLTAVLQ